MNSEAVACGCFKQIAANTIEIKRMYVNPHHRRNGFSQKVLNGLERWASQLGYSKALLETGKGQPEAIALYKKCGYQTIENYGPYKGLSNSICMEKLI
ncbi:MAG: GNAT family N-acetyltransferase [Desulfobacterales bacterium]|nr:GNAT family N-acetyltransferase [Desulfobacterales bacterium]